MKKSYSERKITIILIFLSVGFIYLARLFYLQVIDNSYTLEANRNTLRYITQYPARGLVYDRNGKLLVYNESVYDVMVIPRQVKEMDTLGFCHLLGISKEDFDKNLKKARDYSPFTSSILVKQISKETYGTLQERLFQYPGFYVQPRTLRKYPKPIAAHVLGYIGEVNDRVIEKDPYYRPGDYIGMNGLEKYYEPILRGRKGMRIIMVDVHNREKGGFHNGAFDTVAISGENLYSSIDADLQEYGEKLMQNKRGSIVAVDPSTGEILALISSPGYDPNLLVGRVRGQNYANLLKDPRKPLFDRACMALYPPGSIFKSAQAMVALQEGVITENTGFACDKSLVNCHNHPSAGDLKSAIKMSCNPYFYQVFRRIIMQGKSGNRNIDSRLGLAEWDEYMKSFGLGQRLDIDLPTVKKGYIPTPEFYDKWYGKEHWNFYTIFSLSIGQGEVGMIPLQMANLAAIFANRGYYYTPHLIRGIGQSKIIPGIFKEKHKTKINDKYFKVIADAMYEVVNEPGGTARMARIDSVIVCGKTGTVQNPHGEDHSTFIAFAPMQNPKIAISVYVENAGWGGIWAAPIASLMIEKYLKRDVKRKPLEERMINANLLYLK